MNWRLSALLMAVAGCLPVQPCDEYVDYMCACHADDTGVSCEALEAAYAGAPQEVQDECAVLLNEQQDADEEAGFVCAAGDTG